MQKLDKQSFIEFMDSKLSNISNITDKQKADDFIIDCAIELGDIFEIPKGIEAEDLVKSYLDNNLNYYEWAFYKDPTKQNEIKEEYKINLVFDNSIKKEFKGHSDVLNNLDSIISLLNSLRDDLAKQLINHLQLENKDYRLGKLGTICSPRKYMSNGDVALLNNYSPIEIRLNSKDSAEYRVYGIFRDNNIYLLDAYIKNKGQQHANAYFDDFIKKKANPYIKSQLKESLMYNININNVKEFDTMEEVFKELNNMDKEETLQEKLYGYISGYCNDILEDVKSDAFLEGYKKGTIERNKQKIRNFIKGN